MKTLNLDLPYKAVQGEERKTFPGNSQITEHLIRVLVHVRYAQGMNGTDADLWADLVEQMSLVNSGDDVQPTVELEKSQVLWLIGLVNWCRDNSKVPPMVAHWVRTLLDALEEAKAKGDPKLEAVRKESA